MAQTKTCDVCGFARQRMIDMRPVSDVRRYTLRVEMNQTWENGKRTRRYQKSAGGIDLCGECWSRICEPRMNPKKASNPVSSWVKA